MHWKTFSRAARSSERRLVRGLRTESVATPCRHMVALRRQFAVSKQHFKSCSPASRSAPCAIVAVLVLLGTTAALQSTVFKLIIVWGAHVASLAEGSKRSAAFLGSINLCYSILQPIMWWWQQLRTAQNAFYRAYLVMLVPVFMLVRLYVLKRSAATTYEFLRKYSAPITARWNCFCKPWAVRACCMQWLLAMEKLTAVPVSAMARKPSAALQVALVLHDLAVELQALHDAMTSTVADKTQHYCTLTFMLLLLLCCPTCAQIPAWLVTRKDGCAAFRQSLRNSAEHFRLLETAQKSKPCSNSSSSSSSTSSEIAAHLRGLGHHEHAEVFQALSKDKVLVEALLTAPDPLQSTVVGHVWRFVYSTYRGGSDHVPHTWLLTVIDRCCTNGCQRLSTAAVTQKGGARTGHRSVAHYCLCAAFALYQRYRCWRASEPTRPSK
eukprot:2365-Heterococcus_DN1.PRE.1